jgi:PhzF family phenazine biosynthesis protein
MRLFTVDAFTSTAFQGNPAAVCLLESRVTHRWMQSVATEMDLSRPPSPTAIRVRWFTRAVEVTLCGHGTLATAHVLYSTGAGTGPLQFRTACRTLTVNRLPDGQITMDFRAKEVAPDRVPTGLEKALGVTRHELEKADLTCSWSWTRKKRCCHCLPISRAPAAVNARGVIVTAQGTDTDIVSRFLAPTWACPRIR